MINSQKVKRLRLIGPTTARVTVTQAATMDCLGADYALITVSMCSALTTNAVDPSIAVQHSDDTTVTNFSTTGITGAITTNSQAAKNNVIGVDLKSKKRYIRVLLTPGTTATNDAIVMTVNAQLSRLEEAPSSTSEMVGSTNDAVTLVS